jgi:hypothetical protein
LVGTGGNGAQLKGGQALTWVGVVALEESTGEKKDEHEGKSDIKRGENRWLYLITQSSNLPVSLAICSGARGGHSPESLPAIITHKFTEMQN